MKNILTVMRRDLAAFFTSPVGYMFIVVFLLISVGLYITAFFTFPVADMRSYFGNLPLLLCVFIPAVTMRVWAEERKENTWELLLTFPMKASELVLGKFLACLVFFALTLASTATIPIMLAWLGNPDGGAIFGGYFGTFLLGAYFLAIGIFFSAFCRDQIVAFVVTLFACFALFLVGTGFIAGYIDGLRPGLGTLLGELVGVINHYNAFTRGVVDLVDVLYFVAWTVLFLVLNIMYIEGRHRPGARTGYAIALVLCFSIGLMFNWLASGQSFGRLDLTEDKSYTVSEASKSILSKVDDTVQVKVYITPKAKMPTELASLEQDVTDKLEELRVASNGKIAYTPIYLEAANALAGQEDPFGADRADEPKDEAKAVEERMLDKGVVPFSVRAVGEDTVTNKLIYSSIGIAYKDKKEEILPQIMPQTMPDLEYRLVSTIYKLTREKQPVVALVAPKESLNIPPQQRAIMQQLGQPIPEEEDPYSLLERILTSEKYEVQRVDLTQESPLPAEFDTLVVVNPRNLDERQRWEINRALVSGKSAVLAVQQYEWDYQTSRSGIRVMQRNVEPGVNPLLEKYGVAVSDDILMDVNHVPLNISSGNALTDALGMGQPVDLPTHIILNNTSMNPDTSITSRLSMVFYLWGAALTVNEEAIKTNNLTSQVLMHTSDQSWTATAGETVTEAMFEAPETGQRYPVMAQLAGQFPDAFKDAPRPAWAAAPAMPGQPAPPPEPEDEAAPVTPAPGKLIVLGCSQLFRDNFIQAAPNNLDLFMNSVDAVSLTDDIVHVRGKKPIDRLIDMPKEGVRRFWKAVNYALMSTVIALIGVTTMWLRRRSRNAYTMSFSNVGE